MTDSLLIAGSVELLGGGQTLDWGAGAGAVLRLGPSYDYGAPVVVNDLVASLLLDGERPYGDRASNRTMKIPVEILAPGRVKLLQAREQLLQLVDQNAWELTLTPDGLLPVIFTCFRATIDTSKTGINEEKQDYAHVDLTFQAMPYGRSTDLQTITVAADTAEQLAPILLDPMEVVTNGSTTWFRATTPHIQGTYSMGTLGPNERSWLTSPQDLSQMASIQLYVSMDGRGQARQLGLTLFDNRQRQNPLGQKVKTLRGNNAWDKIEWTLYPHGDFDLSAVTGYLLTVSGGVFLDQMQAMPPWLQSESTDRGAVVKVPGVLGTARAPVSLELARKTPGQPFSQFVVHRVPQEAPALYTPLVPYDTGAVPDGQTTVAAPAVEGIAAGPRWDGTYIVYTNAVHYGGGAGARTVTVTFRQLYNDSGIGPDDHKFASVTAVIDGTDPLAIIGAIDLPLINMAADNSAATWTVAITSSNTLDRFGEVLVLDTRGETLFVNSDRSAPGYWVDEPDTLRDPYDFVGKITGGSSRSQALSVAGSSVVPWRPFSFEPGDNSILLFCPDEQLICTANLFPRWRTVRLA